MATGAGIVQVDRLVCLTRHDIACRCRVRGDI